MTAAVSETDAVSSGDDDTPIQQTGRGVEGFSGDALRQWRTARGMEQEDLAEAAGVSGGQISHLEHGRRRPTIKTLNKLCAALGCAPKDLVRLPGITEQPDPPGGDPVPPPDADALDIDVLMLPATVHRKLVEADKLTVGQLRRMDPRDRLDLLGGRGVKSVTTALAKIGLALQPESGGPAG